MMLAWGVQQPAGVNLVGLVHLVDPGSLVQGKPGTPNNDRLMPANHFSILLDTTLNEDTTSCSHSPLRTTLRLHR